eukprot:25716-Pelagomonas_calceolata.AAC.10
MHRPIAPLHRVVPYHQTAPAHQSAHLTCMQPLRFSEARLFACEATTCPRRLVIRTHECKLRVCRLLPIGPESPASTPARPSFKAITELHPSAQVLYASLVLTASGGNVSLVARHSTTCHVYLFRNSTCSQSTRMDNQGKIAAAGYESQMI